MNCLSVSIFRFLNFHILVTNDDDVFFLGKEGGRKAFYVDFAAGVIGGRICGEAKVSLVYVFEASFMTFFCFTLPKVRGSFISTKCLAVIWG